METYIAAGRGRSNVEKKLIDVGVEVSGYGFVYKGVHCFTYNLKKRQGWYTCEESTGMSFGYPANSKKLSIQEAKDKIDSLLGSLSGIISAAPKARELPRRSTSIR